MDPWVTGTLASAREIHASFSRVLACTRYLVPELYRRCFLVLYCAWLGFSGDYVWKDQLQLCYTARHMTDMLLASISQYFSSDSISTHVPMWSLNWAVPYAAVIFMTEGHCIDLYLQYHSETTSLLLTFYWVYSYHFELIKLFVVACVNLVTYMPYTQLW